jgi:hypothetical protein
VLYRLFMTLFRVALALVLIFAPACFAQAANFCGGSATDWCTSAKDGACGRHANEADCRADAACVALRYSGESLVACHWDKRGFADNCPAVGCQPR